MPKGPQGQKRPADVIGNAIRVARIATGEEEEDRETQPATTIGSEGGKVRATNLGKERRTEIATAAAKARWSKAKHPQN